jgi:hypothetical protein
MTTTHPADIPREVAGSSRPRPVIPARPGPESPARAANPRPPPSSPELPRPACHAGGRGFESRRSRKEPCKIASFVVSVDARFQPTTQTFHRGEPKTAKAARKASQGDEFKPIPATSSPPAKAARDHTKRPEVTAYVGQSFAAPQRSRPAGCGPSARRAVRASRAAEVVRVGSCTVADAVMSTLLAR